MKFLKLALATLLSSAILLVPSAALAAADITTNLCGGANQSALGEGGDCTEDSGGLTVQGVATDIINVFSWIVGIISVIMIIYGGFRYITSAGNDSSVSAAKNTILYAIIGLVIVALAQVIVRFVINKFTTT
jgi:hypothetical protein